MLTLKVGTRGLLKHIQSSFLVTTEDLLSSQTGPLIMLACPTNAFCPGSGLTNSISKEVQGTD